MRHSIGKTHKPSSSSSTKSLADQFTVNDVVAIADAAGADVRTVMQLLRGLPVRTLCAVRIQRAIDAHRKRRAKACA